MRKFFLAWLMIFAFVPTIAFAQTPPITNAPGCAPTFGLYHPNSPAGTKSLVVNNFNSPVEVFASFPPGSSTSCGNSARLFYSWNNNSDNFRLDSTLGKTEKRVNLTSLAVGTYTIKLQTSSDNFSTLLFEEVANLKHDPKAKVETQPPAGDYTPKNVKASDLTSTSVKISWTTVSPSNSEIVYAKATENLNPDKSPPDRAGTSFTNTDNHFLNLSGLTAGTKYQYVVRSSPNKATTATKSEVYTFTTKNADGTGGTIGGKAEGEIDSTIGIKNNIDLDKPVGTLFNPLGDDLSRPEGIILRIINLLLMAAGILAVIFIIIGGFLMVTSAGNASRLGQGKKTLIYAIAGLVLTLLSFSIVAIVQSIIS